jgi:superfamily II DNA or RNA helicase
MNIVLRKYQKEILQALNRFEQKGGKRALVVAAQGTGKRLTSITHSLKYNKILFICHTEELIEQAREEFENFYPMQIGIVKAQQFDIGQKVTISSPQTLYKRLDKIPENTFDLIIVDECHRYLAKTWIIPLHYFQPKMMTGWTATPTRLDGLNMSNIFEEIVYDYPIDKAINEGYLCKLDAYRIKTQCDLSTLHKLGGDFKLNELSDKVDTDERNRLIVEKYLEYAEGRQTLAFCVDIKHAERLRDCFKAKCINCEMIVSDKELCDNRKELVSDFKNKKIQVITNVEILTTGFDYCDVACILMARPTQSLALYLQSIGRVTRIKSDVFQFDFGKNDGIILDIVDVSGKHNLINTWTLEEGKRIEDRIFMNDERKTVLIEKRDSEQREREAKVLKIIGKDRKINLLPIPKCIIPFYYLATNAIATEAQLGYMKKIGVYQEGVEYTKGQASELISNSCATSAQIYKLNSLGYDVSKGVSRGEAELAFRDAESRGLIPKKEETLRVPFKI